MASEACSLSSLDLFDKVKYQSAIKTSQDIEYKPISTLSDDGAIRFSFPGNTSDFIDLSHTMISMKCKILVDDGTTKTTAEDKISTVQMPIASAFAQVWLLCFFGCF